jgi:hypothetical protein
MTFISIHSVIIYVVFFGACMRCTRLCPLKPGVTHAVLGRPCYAKFMAVPNYTYLKLKMPDPNGVITVGSTYQHAYECNMECVEYAEALTESEALIADLESLSKEAPDVKRHAGNFEPAEAVKSVPLDPSNNTSKQVRIGSELDPK